MHGNIHSSQLVAKVYLNGHLFIPVRLDYGSLPVLSAGQLQVWRYILLRLMKEQNSFAGQTTVGTTILAEQPLEIHATLLHRSQVAQTISRMPVSAKVSLDVYLLRCILLHTML